MYIVLMSPMRLPTTSLLLACHCQPRTLATLLVVIAKVKWCTSFKMILQNVLFGYEEYGNEVVFEDLFIICCRHVTLVESTDCI